MQDSRSFNYHTLIVPPYLRWQSLVESGYKILVDAGSNFLRLVPGGFAGTDHAHQVSNIVSHKCNSEQPYYTVVDVTQKHERKIVDVEGDGEYRYSHYTDDFKAERVVKKTYNFADLQVLFPEAFQLPDQ